MAGEWLGVWPAVVASILTTLLTMFIVGTAKAIKNWGSRKKTPLLLRRDLEQWSLRGTARTAIHEASAFCLSRASDYRIIPFPGDMIEPKVPTFVGSLAEGDVFVVQWIERRRWGRDRNYSAQAHIGGDSREYLLERELYAYSRANSVPPPERA